MKSEKEKSRKETSIDFSSGGLRDSEIKSQKLFSG